MYTQIGTPPIARRIRQWVRAVLVACLALVLTACWPPRTKITSLPPEDSLLAWGGASSEIATDVFYDATSSMSGFVSEDNSTVYERTIPRIESSILSSWQRPSIAHLKFGTKIEALDGRRHLEATRPAFYHSGSTPSGEDGTPGSLHLQTRIDKVIDQADAGHLTLIVTDLFQTDSDANLLANRIREKVLEQGRGLGLCAIRSEFKGTVYDVGSERAEFAYDTGSDPQKFRPFYILALGLPGDIGRFFSAFSTAMEDEIPIECLVLSSLVCNEPGSFAGGSVTKLSRLVEVNNLFAPSLSDPRAKQYRLRAGPESAHIEGRIPFTKAKYAVGFDPGSSAVRVRVWRTDADGRMVEAEEESDNLRVSVTDVTETDFGFSATLDPTGLNPQYTYCFAVSVLPKTYHLPPWVQALTMDVKQIDAWRRNPREFQGATTLNLRPLVATIWESALQIEAPRIAHFFFYVDPQ